jgi:hypothetical protein
MAAVDLSEYNGNQLVITSIFFLVMTWLSVGLRTYVRTVLTHNFVADDWLMLVAQVSRRGPEGGPASVEDEILTVCRVVV